MNIRTAFVVVRATRNWRHVAIPVFGVSAVSILLGRNNVDFLAQVAYFGIPLIAIKAIADVFQYAQRASVWSMLAQRGESDTQTLRSILWIAVLVYAFLAVVLAVGIATGGAINPEMTSGGAKLVVLALWMFLCGVTVATTATFSRAGTAGFAILWMVLPIANGFVQRSLGYSDAVRDALNFLFPPIDAIFVVPQLIEGIAVRSAAVTLAQLFVFPLLCVVIVHWRLKALANPDLPRIE